METNSKEKLVKEKQETYPVFGLDGKQTDVFSLKGLLEKVTAKGQKLLAEYIYVYRVNQREGNASTKTRAEITGTTKKVYKQKGTGRARHGSKKAPIFVGGGVVGGPKPKDFALQMNKKKRTSAFVAAVSEKSLAGNLLGLKGGEDVLKTKQIVAFLKSLTLTSKKVLFIVGGKEQGSFVKSARNIDRVRVRSILELNAYDIIDANKVIVLFDSIPLLQKRIQSVV